MCVADGESAYIAHDPLLADHRQLSRIRPTMASKRSHAAANASPEDEEPVDPSDELMFLALGGGNEVGRSCHIIQYKGKTVMLDAGIHPAFDGLAALPFYDEFDLSTVDILLITQ